MSGKHDNQVRSASDPAAITAAATILRGGGLVAVPTETVYGLAARADDAAAVAAIYRAKGRPDFNPLIVHITGIDQAEHLAMPDPRARALAAAFWPGPLTMVLPLRGGARIAPAVTAGLPTIALRSPAHPVMQAVLRETRLPLAAPSANRSGAVSPTRAEHVVASLGARVDMVLDGGACAAGIESTIVALRGNDTWQVLRPGPITAERIAAVLGTPPMIDAAQGIEAPGQMTSHYAPGKPIRLNAITPNGQEYLIGFGPVAGETNLSPGADLAEAASRLYECLHRAAASPLPRIAVAPVPDHGLGIAINDRLRRAAAWSSDQ
ncbi:MAG: threonylcarbamoyl-AMP synthase [Proteobacteria bacterium]|nr:threonylcarbamoyl-AMP synthase [Pseudomonadota bacterium]